MSEFLKNRNALSSILSKLKGGVNQKLKRSGWLEFEKLVFKQIRKKDISEEKISNDLEAYEKNDFKRLAYFLFNESFSDTVQPEYLLNIIFYNNTSLYFKEESTDLKLFFLVAINKNNLGKNYDFKDSCSKLFNQLNGVIGYFFETVPFHYDGESSLLWAHQNILVKTKSNDLNNWIEEGEKL